MRVGKSLLLIAAILFAASNVLFFGGYLTWHHNEAYDRLRLELRTTEDFSLQGLSSVERSAVKAAGSDDIPGCRDREQTCPSRAQAGDCISHAAYTLPNCRQSCGVCRFQSQPKLAVRKKVQLNNGHLMPVMGFGTAGLASNTFQAVSAALALGYQLIDTAQAEEWYNEAEVGKAIEASGINRTALFITSKLHPRHFAQAASKFADSLANLRTTYLDLFLLHYSSCWGSLCLYEEKGTAGSWQVAWRSLEGLVHSGKIRALGVSNFALSELSELIRHARIKPSVIQGQSDPLRSNILLQVFCERAGIQFQGYSTLGSQWLMRGRIENPVLSHSDIFAIAESHDMTTAQVVLRWAMQHGQAVVPRSADVEHMAKNKEAVHGWSLSRREMLILDALDGTQH